MTALLFGLFGLTVGSFLNVVILRHGHDSVRGRSVCMHCSAQLRWFELIPVVSWLALGGRCRSCGARISLQYPLVEAMTALLFAGVGGASLPPLFFPLGAQLLDCIVASLLIVIAVYDIRHKLIPDIWVWSFIALAFLWALMTTALLPISMPLWPMLLAGPIAAAPILFLWYLSKPFTGAVGQWMGFGDVKLALGIGWLLGFPLGLAAIFFAFILGAVISVGILLPLPAVARALGITQLEGGDAHLTMKSEVPFGPFLIASCLLVWCAVLYDIHVPILEIYGL